MRLSYEILYAKNNIHIDVPFYCFSPQSNVNFTQDIGARSSPDIGSLCSQGSNSEHSCNVAVPPNNAVTSLNHNASAVSSYQLMPTVVGSQQNTVLVSQTNAQPNNFASQPNSAWNMSKMMFEHIRNEQMLREYMSFQSNTK